MSQTIPFFVRKASEQGLSIRTGVKAGAREQTIKLKEEESK